MGEYEVNSSETVHEGWSVRGKGGRVPCLANGGICMSRAAQNIPTSDTADTMSLYPMAV